MADIFDQLDSVKPTRGGNWIQDGSYKFAVENIIRENGEGGEYVAAELRVLEALQDPANPEFPPNPVGSVVSVVFQFDKFKSAKANFKAFAIAVLGSVGYTEAQVTGAKMRELCGSGNPARGIVVKCRTYRKTARDSKKVLTLPNFESAARMDKVAVKASRDMLDAGTYPTAVATASPSGSTSRIESPAMEPTGTPDAQESDGNLLDGLL